MNSKIEINSDVVIDIKRADDYPNYLIDGVEYELLCDYNSRFDNQLVEVLVKKDGNEAVIKYGQDAVCIGCFSAVPDKINDLLNYIEASISLKSGFGIYSTDLSKHLDEALSQGERHPIIRNELEFKNTAISRLVNRVHQSRVAKEVFDKPFNSDKLIYQVNFIEPIVSLENEHADADSQREKIHSVEVDADNLSAGWKWVMYNDGSGHLESPTGNSYFSYDKTTYGLQGGIEFKTFDEYKWDVFWGTFEEFKEHAEDVVSKEFCLLGKFNISKIMNSLADNAWFGREPTTVRLITGDNVIEMNGYTYEPSYECFSATSSISLNGEILYGQNSRNVEAYRYEVYMTGKYESLNAALSHIKEKVSVKELVLESDVPQVENIISNAEAQAKQRSAEGETNKDKDEFDIDL